MVLCRAFRKAAILARQSYELPEMRAECLFALLVLRGLQGRHFAVESDAEAESMPLMPSRRYGPLRSASESWIVRCRAVSLQRHMFPFGSDIQA
jgi:hypothetical protein